MSTTESTRKRATIALMGNPNAGKSSIFNAMTGLHQHVGNWPGKTVEKRAGRCISGGWELSIVDLPGTYSLAAESPEEMVAREFLLSGEADLVIDVIDATNLERNLYLTVQILELGMPTILALNMADQLELQGGAINAPMLSDALGGMAIVATAANRGRGVTQLLAVTVEMLEQNGFAEVTAALPIAQGVPA